MPGIAGGPREQRYLNKWDEKGLGFEANKEKSLQLRSVQTIKTMAPTRYRHRPDPPAQRPQRTCGVSADMNSHFTDDAAEAQRGHPALGPEVPLWLPPPVGCVPYACPVLAPGLGCWHDRGIRKMEKKIQTSHKLITIKNKHRTPISLENHQNCWKKKKRVTGPLKSEMESTHCETEHRGINNNLIRSPRIFCLVFYLAFEEHVALAPNGGCSRKEQAGSQVPGSSGGGVGLSPWRQTCHPPQILPGGRP